MQWQDATLLAKKIVLGIGLTLVPLIIVWGGLKLTQQTLRPAPTSTQTLQPKK